MIWQIAFWVWLVGIFVTAFVGVMATLIDPEIDATEVSWPKAALAYIFWPIAFVAVLAAVAWAKRTDARLARSPDTPCKVFLYVTDCPCAGSNVGDEPNVSSHTTDVLASTKPTTTRTLSS